MKYLTRAVLVMLLSASFSLAQTTVKEPSNYDWHFIESSGVFWGGVSADWISGRGVSESNPYIRNSQGRLDNRKFWTLNVVGFAATVALQKKWPRAMNWTRRLMGGVHGTAAAHNYFARHKFPNEAVRQ